VVDYIICGQELTQSIENFIVKPPTYLSYHSQLVTWIKRASTHVSISETTHTQQPKTHRLPQQFIWDNDSITKFTENLKSFQTQQNLQYLINSNPSPSKEGVNLFAAKVTYLIMHATKKSMKIKKKKYRNKASNVSNKKWFDKECRLQRHSVRRLANQKHRDPLNTEIRDKYHATLKIYKNTLKRNKELFHEKKTRRTGKSF
jgi:hypothetical protein